MRIIDIINRKKVAISFEVFPPKAESSFHTVGAAVGELAALEPDFISVTYGAGGGTSKNTLRIASLIENMLGKTALAHLSCASLKKEELWEIVDALAAEGIMNILALRGDIGGGGEPLPERGCRYASELVEAIRKRGDFCIGGACYPEGHPEAENTEKDLEHLKTKVDAGCDFLITQMFFDNNQLYSFLYRAARKGIEVPVIAGIMPVTNARQIKRISALSGAKLTTKVAAMVDKFQDDDDSMLQAGIAYATEQIVDLIVNGVRGIHIYTMNKPEVAMKIVENISSIIK